MNLVWDCITGHFIEIPSKLVRGRPTGYNTEERMLARGISIDSSGGAKTIRIFVYSRNTYEKLFNSREDGFRMVGMTTYAI